jgi:NAD(P)-dependent dehydrogenase (short-subunit alcohol dehydrogenase family)
MGVKVRRLLTAVLGELASRAAGDVVGDLRSAAETRSIADRVNAIGRMDAIIHNAGVYAERTLTAEVVRSEPIATLAKSPSLFWC